jgi:Protein of unknown function (DUF3038)
MMPASMPKLDDLSLTLPLDSAQLNQITRELDLVAVAIAALLQVDRIKVSQAAQNLQVESIISDWINQWSLSQAASCQYYDLEQLRALVLVVNNLAQAHQPVIRQRIDDWQQIIQSGMLPLQSPPLAEYIGNFITIYQIRLGKEVSQSFDALSEAALDLLVELLFYSSSHGHQRLWGALINRSHSQIQAIDT